MSASLVLGIESSCDEMAAAVIADGQEIRASVVHGQADLHRPYGGVVPEIASRDHARAVSQVVEAALAEAGVQPAGLSGVAVTAGPGLVGSLLVGLSFAKGFAYRFGLPLVGVHHLVGHLLSSELAEADHAPPYLGLVVSGGHTALYRVEAEGPPGLLGETRDDAAGEAFDKVAKLLGLEYPGGPAISRVAKDGDPEAFDFPRPMTKGPGYDFSYSGLKTAVSIEIERLRAAVPGGELGEAQVADLAASFQAAAVDPLVLRVRKAVRREGHQRVAVVGGVAANGLLRERMHAMGDREGFGVVFPRCRCAPTTRR